MTRLVEAAPLVFWFREQSKRNRSKNRFAWKGKKVFCLFRIEAKQHKSEAKQTWNEAKKMQQNKRSKLNFVNKNYAKKTIWKRNKKPNNAKKPIVEILSIKFFFEKEPHSQPEWSEREIGGGLESGNQASKYWCLHILSRPSHMARGSPWRSPIPPPPPPTPPSHGQICVIFSVLGQKTRMASI